MSQRTAHGRRHRRVARAGLRRARSKAQLEALFPKYPTKQACLLPALWMVQEARGWISEPAMAEVAEVLGLTPAYVKGVVTFYTMYHTHPVGRHFIQVCTTSPCNLCGAEDVLQALLARVGLRRAGRHQPGRPLHGRSRSSASAPAASRRRSWSTTTSSRASRPSAFPASSPPTSRVQVMGYPHPSHPEGNARPLEVLRGRRRAHLRRAGSSAAATRRCGRRSAMTPRRGDRGGQAVGPPRAAAAPASRPGSSGRFMPKDDGKPHYLVLQRRRVGAGHLQGPRDHALDAARS